jgi:hypothetical protein
MVVFRLIACAGLREAVKKLPRRDRREPGSLELQLWDAVLFIAGAHSLVGATVGLDGEAPPASHRKAFP